MAKFIVFEQRNEKCAAIDIGSTHIYVSCDGITSKSFRTFTQGYRECISYLKAGHIKQVCMEATGIYWIPLYQMLEEAGMDVCLVNPKEVKQVKGRKTDVSDSCWIQRVFAAGLVRQSYIPAGKLKELRMLVREREDTIEVGSSYISKMQKCLELMNIKITEVISQIHGVSGISMIEAMLSGERNPQNLLEYCHVTIREKKAEEMLKALEGNYNNCWLFMLGQNLELWKTFQKQVAIIDKQIELTLEELGANKEQVVAKRQPKPIRHHRPSIKDLHQKLLKIYGVDINGVPGVTDYTLLRLLGECGPDMSRFPTVKHFVSWCQLAPMQNDSGKSKRNARVRNGSKAGQIFREIALGLLNSKYIAIGAFIRRIRGRKDSKIAIKAGARKVATAFYNLLTKGSEYVERGVAAYEEQLKQREKGQLHKLAKKYGLALVENQ